MKLEYNRQVGRKSLFRFDHNGRTDGQKPDSESFQRINFDSLLLFKMKSFESIGNGVELSLQFIHRGIDLFESLPFSMLNHRWAVDFVCLPISMVHHR